MTIPAVYKFINWITGMPVPIDDAIASAVASPVDSSLNSALTTYINSVVAPVVSVYSLVVTNDGTILTVALKDKNGADFTSSNSLTVPMRSSTLTSGTPDLLVVNSALSINTNAAGASLGTRSGSIAFKLWVCLFDNGGTPVLALWQSLSWSSALITRLNQLNVYGLASTTGFSAGATAAGTFYTPNGINLTNKPFRVLGFLEFGSGLVTAGTYASNPTEIQLATPDLKLPGAIIQSSLYGPTFNNFRSSSSVYQDTGSSAIITPTLASNVIRTFYGGPLYNEGAAGATVALVTLFRGATDTGACTCGFGTTSAIISHAGLGTYDFPNSTAAQTYTIKVKNNDNVTFYQMNANVTGVTTNISLEELMT